MAIDTINKLNAAGRHRQFFWTGANGQQNNTVRISVIDAAGVPAAAAASTGGTNYHKGDPGFIPYPSGDCRLVSFLGGQNADAQTTRHPVEHIIDVLWAAKFVCNVTTEQVVTGFPGLPRYTDGLGLELAFCMNTVPTGIVTSVATIRYTNELGVGNRTATILNTAATSAQFQFVGIAMLFKLQAGDRGVLSVEGFTLSAAHGSAGELRVVIFRRVAGAYSPPNMAIFEQLDCDISNSWFQSIGDDAALMGASLSLGASADHTVSSPWILEFAGD